MKNSIDWRKTFISVIFAVYGGFVGAVFGLYAVGLHSGTQVWFLIFIYGVLTILLVWLLNFRRSNEKKKN